MENKNNNEVIGRLDEPVKIDSGSNHKSPVARFLVVVLTITGIALSFLSGYLAYAKFSVKDNKNQANNSITNQDTIIESKVTINHEGYAFQVPSNIFYDIRESLVYLRSSDNTWEGLFKINDRNISSVIDNKTAITEKLTAEGASVIRTEENQIEGKDYIIFYMEHLNRKFFIGYLKAGINNVISFELYNIDNDYNINYLNDVLNTLATEKYVGTTKAISANPLLDLNLMEKALQ